MGASSQVVNVANKVVASHWDHIQHHLPCEHVDDENDMDDENDLTNRFRQAQGVRFKLFISEFIGTFVFVYMGQSALTSFELMGTQNDILIRQVATIFAYGLAYSLASFLTINLSSAQLNPAYTVARAMFGHLSWVHALVCALGQYLGSFLAAFFLHATFNDKLNQRHVEGLLSGANVSLRAHGNILSTGKLFSSYPPTEVSLSQLFVSYTLASAQLMLLLLAIHEARLVKIRSSMQPVYLAAALCLVLCAFCANGGPVTNPAQDLSPRLYISLFGWGSAAFNLHNFKYWWLCGLMAPHLGALIGFALYRLLERISTIDDDIQYHNERRGATIGHRHRGPTKGNNF